MWKFQVIAGFHFSDFSWRYRRECAMLCEWIFFYTKILFNCCYAFFLFSFRWIALDFTQLYMKMIVHNFKLLCFSWWCCGLSPLWTASQQQNTAEKPTVSKRWMFFLYYDAQVCTKFTRWIQQQYNDKVNE